MLKAYINCIKNYFNLQGRASVADYWLAVLMNFIIALVLGAITGILVFVATLISEDFGGIVSILMSVVSGIYSLAVMIPFITLAVRRLHDTIMHL